MGRYYTSTMWVTLRRSPETETFLGRFEDHDRCELWYGNLAGHVGAPTQLVECGRDCLHFAFVSSWNANHRPEFEAMLAELPGLLHKPRIHCPLLGHLITEELLPYTIWWDCDQQKIFLVQPSQLEIYRSRAGYC